MTTGKQLDAVALLEGPNARLIASAPVLAREVIALRARVEVLEKALLALEAARQFIMSKYRDPADEVNGEWLAKEAREFSESGDAINWQDALRLIGVAIAALQLKGAE